MDRLEGPIGDSATGSDADLAASMLKKNSQPQTEVIKNMYIVDHCSVISFVICLIILVSWCHLLCHFLLWLVTFLESCCCTLGLKVPQNTPSTSSQAI